MLLVASSAVFGLPHLEWSVANAATASVTGLLFGTLALRTRSIWPAVVAHTTANYLSQLL